MTSVSDLYRTMEYGPVSDSCSLAEGWLKNKTFGPFIDGSWESSKDASNSYEVKNPCTGETIATIIPVETEQVKTVVTSAITAQSSWSKLPGHERAKYLYSIARHLQKHASLLVQMESLNRGVQSKDPRGFDVPAMVRHFYYYAGWAQLHCVETVNKGIVLGITSAISPLVTLAWIIAPALAAGCTVILKPSRRAPLTAYLFAEICNQAGLPAGVLNVVPCSKETGRSLAKSDVNYITFCGLTAVGREIRQETAGLCKSFTFSLSGKTPMIVFDSADLNSALEGVIECAWFNQGQVSWAIQTLLVQESVFEDFVANLKTKTISVGNAFDKMADVGQPIDKTVIANVSEVVSEATRNGIEVFQNISPSSFPADSFFPPTFLIGGQGASNKVTSEDSICPVVSVIPFRTAKEAIALANNTRYGVAASVWTESAALALDVASQLQVGTVWINCHGIMDASIPFCGWKQSGLGTFGGREALLEYMHSKNTSAAVESNEMDYKAFEAGKGTADLEPTDANRSCGCIEVDRTYKLYYGGAHKRPDGNSSRIIKDRNGKPSYAIAEGNKKDIRNAVETAVAAQRSWWKSGSFLRSQIIYNVAEKLQARTQDLTRHMESFAPESSNEISNCLDILFQWAACCDKRSTANENSIPVPNITVQTSHEPFGVIGIIIDDDSCLCSFVEHMAAAISYGNSVVVVPNMTFPTPAMELCQVFDTSDIPKGVINVVTGDKQVLVSALAQHQNVRAIWYSGDDSKMIKYIEWASSHNMKHTWIHAKWEKNVFPREVFELNGAQSKAVWIPFGEIFAN